MSGSLVEVVNTVLVYLDNAVLGYFIVVNAFYAMLMASAAVTLRDHQAEHRHESHLRGLSSELMPRITVLVPAYNEAATVEPSLQALLTLAYSNLEIVVVDDGSTDGTPDMLIEAFDLAPVRLLHDTELVTAPLTTTYRSRRFPNLIFATKPNAGKADALNAALNLATGELVCAVDADTIIEVDALQKLVRPFLMSQDVVAAGATIRIANGCTVRYGRVVAEQAPRGAVCGFQAVEYLRAFLFGRLGWNRIGGNLVISGAFGLFRRESLVGSGGYAKTVGEDMELVVRLRRLGYERRQPTRVEFVPDPVAWTEAPESLTILGHQRDRWQRGLTDALWRHRRLFFNPRYGTLGMVAVPAFVLVEWLAPIVEATGLLAVPLGLLVGAVDARFALLYFAAAYGLGLVFSATALLLEELAFRRYGRPAHRARLVLWAALENLGYRQLTAFWRLRGTIGQMRGRTEWGAMRRRGFTARS